MRIDYEVYEDLETPQVERMRAPRSKTQKSEDDRETERKNRERLRALQRQFKAQR